MTYKALIPVKTLDEAKSRLSLHLTQAQRRSLVLEMLYHVVRALHGSEYLEGIAVVSPDPRVLDLVRTWGVEPLRERQHGHNPALHAAAQDEIASGATGLLTISADLPLLATQDINGMIEASMRESIQYDVVLAPSCDGTGTNALFVHPPLAVPYVFGPGSLQRYVKEADQRHLSSTLYKSLGTALDIDTIEDIEMLRHYEREGREMRAT